MPLLVKARSFLRNLFLSRGVEAELDKEVHSHLELLIAENIRAGMTPREAERAARMELGGVEQVKEEVREQQMGNWLRSVFSDCRYGLRQLRKNPGGNGGDDFYAGAGDRRGYGDFQRGVWGIAAAAAVSGCEPDHGGV